MKEAAVKAGIPVFQPERIKREDGVTALTSLAPDLCVTAAFGQLLSQELISLSAQSHSTSVICCFLQSSCPLFCKSNVSDLRRVYS